MYYAMDRRSVLVGAGGTVAALLGGCLQTQTTDGGTHDAPGSERELERVDGLRTDEEFVEHFRESVDDLDVETLVLERETALDGGILVLEYANRAAVEDVDWRANGPVEEEAAAGVFDEMMAIAEEYAVVVGSGWTMPELLGVNTFFRNANFYYTWHVESEWAEAYFEGGLSRAEYWEHVLDTASLVGPPAPGE